MPRAKTNKLYRTFVKGLITEASPLTYPEDASVEELNTLLSRKGNRTRRRGIRYEEDFVLNDLGITDDDAVNEYVWHSVGKVPAKIVVAIQIGTKIHFWDKDESPMSDHKLDFTVDLLEYKAEYSTPTEVQTQMCSFASGSGYLFLAHPACDPVVIEYRPETNSYMAVKVLIQIRDFEGVYDGLANDEEPSSLSPEHHYNLKNQGWLSPGEGTSSGGGTGGGGTFYDPYTGESYPYTPGGGGGGRPFNNNTQLQ